MTIRPITLNVTSPFEMPISKKFGSDIWKSFLERGTLHSAQAASLPYIIRRCEREKVEYVLTASPGEGYFIIPVKRVPKR